MKEKKGAVIGMVLTGKIKRVAFYCRMNHRDHDYSQFFEEVRAMIEQRYGRQEWELHHYFEVASGADPNRIQFGKLKSDIWAGNMDAVVTIKTEMLARDWTQFLEFMKLCEEKQVDVFCSREDTDAMAQYQRIQEFLQNYVEGDRSDES
ncbi:MAG: recombinase family protein [Lachnospiraceae bacterium]